MSETEDGLCVQLVSILLSAHIYMRASTYALLNAMEHAGGVCMWRLSLPMSWDVCGEPSGHSCHAVVPVKCCQRGRCGLPWRLDACCAALPTQAATSEKEIWVTEMEGLLPSYFQSPLPVQHHPRYSIWEPECVWCLRCMRVLEGGGEEGEGVLCMREASDFYEDFLVLHLSLQACVSWRWGAQTLKNSLKAIVFN